MTGCEPFDTWCAINREQSLPAAPATVARFVGDVAASGIMKIWSMIGEISRAHYLIGLADPTLGGAVTGALNDIANIEPPASYPDQMKLRFRTLPYDIAAYLASREKDQRREFTRINERAAGAEKALAAIQKPERVDNGTSETAVA
jgi:hypothetical protein